jgi:hypothetical protein
MSMLSTYGGFARRAQATATAAVQCMPIRTSIMVIWIDLYDANLKLWKITWGAPRAENVPEIGHVTTNSTTGAVWYVQNSQMTMVSTVDPSGVGPKFNQDDPPDDYTKYGTPGGLMQILR